MNDSDDGTDDSLDSETTDNAATTNYSMPIDGSDAETIIDAENTTPIATPCMRNDMKFKNRDRRRKLKRLGSSKPATVTTEALRELSKPTTTTTVTIAKPSKFARALRLLQYPADLYTSYLLVSTFGVSGVFAKSALDYMLSWDKSRLFTKNP